MVFWINLPIGVLAIAMFAIFLPETVERRQHRLDYLGGVLLVVGVGSLMLALVQARSLGSLRLFALVGLGATALALLYRHERRAEEPMLPLTMWRRRVVALCNLGGFGGSATAMAVSALLPTYVQGVMGGSPAMAGVVIAAQSVSWMFAAFAAGRLMIRTSYRLTASIGGVSLLIAALMLAVLEPGSLWLWPASAAFISGIGMEANVGYHERGIGTGSQMFMRMLGMSVGAAAYGAILNFGVDRLLPGAGEMVNRMLDPATRQSLGPDTLARLGDAVGLAAHHAFLLAAVIAAVTVTAALALPARLSPIRPGIAETKPG